MTENAKVTNGKGGKDGNKVGKSNKPAIPDVHVLEPQSMETVLRSCIHHNTVAIICEYLVEYTADTFRGTDARGPRKLLLFANGTRAKAEIEDVRAVERLLQDAAADARSKMRRLDSVTTHVERELLMTEEPRGPRAPVPTGEGVCDAPGPKPVMRPGAKPAAPSETTTTKGW